MNFRVRAAGSLSSDKTFRIVTVDANWTVSQVIDALANTILGSAQRPPLALVHVHNSLGPQYVDDSVQMKLLPGVKDGDALELRTRPLVVTAAILDNFSDDVHKAVAEGKQMKIDAVEPLSDSIPFFERIFKVKNNSEYVIQFFDRANRSALFLNTNMSISEQGVKTDTQPTLLLTNAAGYAKLHAKTTKAPEKEGWLTKSSVKDGSETPIKSRYIVLRENFLFYYKSPSESSAAGVVPLEYFTLSSYSASPTSFVFELAPSGTGFHKNAPMYRFATESDLECRSWVSLILSKCSNGVRKRVFGVPLERLANRKGAMVDKYVPLVIHKCVKALDGKLRTEGLFRLSGSAAATEKVRIEFDDGGDPDLTNEDAHLVASLMKMWLRELPEPLIPYTSYDALIKVSESMVTQPSVNDKESAVSAMKNIFASLPLVNLRLLDYLTRFLCRVAENADVNKMHSGNLAVVIGPNILHARPDDDTNLVQNTSHVNVIVQVMIDRVTDIFDGLADTVAAERRATKLQKSPRQKSPRGEPPLSAKGPAVAPYLTMKPGQYQSPVSNQIQLAMAAAAAASNTNAAASTTGTTATSTATPNPTEKLNVINNGDRVIAMYDYTGSNEREHTFKKDDIFQVISKLESGWMQCRSEATSKIAMVPITYVELYQAVPLAAAALAPAQSASATGGNSPAPQHAAAMGAGSPSLAQGRTGVGIGTRGALSSSVGAKAVPGTAPAPLGSASAAVSSTATTAGVSSSTTTVALTSASTNISASGSSPRPIRAAQSVAMTVPALAPPTLNLPGQTPPSMIRPPPAAAALKQRPQPPPPKQMPPPPLSPASTSSPSSSQGTASPLALSSLDTPLPIASNKIETTSGSALPRPLSPRTVPGSRLSTNPVVSTYGAPVPIEGLPPPPAEAPPKPFSTGSRLSLQKPDDTASATPSLQQVLERLEAVERTVELLNQKLAQETKAREQLQDLLAQHGIPPPAQG